MFKDKELAPVIVLQGQVSPLGISSIKINIKYNEGHTHQETFNEVYYFQHYPKVLISPQKWAMHLGGGVISG